MNRDVHLVPLEPKECSARAGGNIEHEKAFRGGGTLKQGKAVHGENVDVRLVLLRGENVDVHLVLLQPGRLHLRGRGRDVERREDESAEKTRTGGEVVPGIGVSKFKGLQENLSTPAPTVLLREL